MWITLWISGELCKKCIFLCIKLSKTPKKVIMFYTVTKKTIIVIIIIIICLILPAAISVAVSDTTPRNKFVIVIDAGHGGIDDGVRGKTTGVSESELNLKMAKLLKEYFSDADFRVVLTRETSAGLYGIKMPGFKKRDMECRKKIIEREKPDIVLSVHMNFYTSSVRRGLQVFYHDKNESRRLANEIQNIVNLNVNLPVTGRNLISLYGDYFILKCTEAPSVIVECGFLSNPLDEELLISHSYRKELAYYIFTGVINYINCPIQS